jgi:uncharacterized protein DUF4349
MNTHRLIPASFLILLLAVLSACGPAAAPTYAPAEPAAPWGDALAPAAAPAVPEQAADAAPAKAEPQSSDAAAIFQTGPDTITSGVQYADQKIIKNAALKLLVADTDVAVDGVTQIAGDVRGYIISSRVWSNDYFGTAYSYATITMGVPVDQFEQVLRRLRGLAVKVLDEQASGEDVTDQFVDLQSRLTNLEATRDRVRGFLDQAQNVDEALKINQQLSQIESEIEQVKGEMNYIQNRSAFSTITVTIEPELPDIVLTPTPTATPVPLQPLAPWDPARTASRASTALASTYRVIADVLIWLFVVILPVLGPPILIVWLAVWYWRKRTNVDRKRS